MTQNKGSLRQALSESSMFSGLSGDDLRALESSVTTRSYVRGELLFEVGQEAHGLYLVTSGRVRAFRASPEGKEHVLGVMGPGEPVGEVALFSGRRYPASADALDDATAVFLSRDTLLRLIGERPQLALNMIATLAERLRRFAGQVEALSLKEVPARLADYLLETARREGSSLVVELSVTKSQLARQLGTVPETLSRSLAKLRHSGIIEVDKARVTILDERVLKELAAGDKVL